MGNSKMCFWLFKVKFSHIQQLKSVLFFQSNDLHILVLKIKANQQKTKTKSY